MACHYPSQSIGTFDVLIKMTQTHSRSTMQLHSTCTINKTGGTHYNCKHERYFRTSTIFFVVLIGHLFLTEFYNVNVKHLRDILSSFDDEKHRLAWLLSNKCETHACIAQHILVAVQFCRKLNCNANLIATNNLTFLLPFSLVYRTCVKRMVRLKRKLAFLNI